MSDFFGSLVDRVLDRGPALQRRQPALFEPVPSANVSAPPEFETEPLKEEQTVVERDSFSIDSRSTANAVSFRPPPNRTVEEPVPAPERAPSRQVDGPLEIELQQYERRNIREESRPAAPEIEPEARIIRERQPTHSAMPQATAGPESVIALPPRQVETIVERRIEREVISEQIKAPSAFDRAALSVPPANASRRDSHEHHKESPQQELKNISKVNPPQQESAFKPLNRRSPVPPRVSAPVGQVPRPKPARTVNQAPPHIHVTIGRIEVKATHQTASRPPAARSTGPKLSLDAYLRSRGEGD